MYTVELSPMFILIMIGNDFIVELHFMRFGCLCAVSVAVKLCRRVAEKIIVKIMKTILWIACADYHYKPKSALFLLN